MRPDQIHAAQCKSLGVLFFLLLTGVLFLCPATAAEPPSTPKSEGLMANIRPKVEQELRGKGFSLGQPIFIRIFKLPGVLEVWMNRGKGFELFKSYRICNYSGFPGPKLSEGDWQAPEGFYTVSAEQMNPKSVYHLAFDIGYPNEFDVAKNRTGGLIMVHGNCQSVGCFAMTNARMEEIYLLANESLRQGQEYFGVHIFPFALTPLNLKKFAASPWMKFWRSLEPGYTAFEQSRRVPDVTVQNGEYVVVQSTRKLAMQQMFAEDRR
ncbi:MAG: murein L,D-transpeptidase [Desulfobulbus sp.]|nr:murein L,D-transpeptidase [Desulfobulbus sp.]